MKYAPGRVVNQMATAYRGEAKTDSRDAYVIAETTRHCGDLAEIDIASKFGRGAAAPGHPPRRWVWGSSRCRV